mmetsp:Transcript_11689/g.23796  ORF Transcript_11689/g.23796 Transcript_11689/m.23796 type:complete len:236 (-) Transcript_11689:84-791(-)
MVDEWPRQLTIQVETCPERPDQLSMRTQSSHPSTSHRRKQVALPGIVPLRFELRRKRLRRRQPWQKPWHDSLTRRQRWPTKPQLCLDILMNQTLLFHPRRVHQSWVQSVHIPGSIHQSPTKPTKRITQPSTIRSTPRIIPTITLARHLQPSHNNPEIHTQSHTHTHTHAPTQTHTSQPAKDTSTPYLTLSFPLNGLLPPFRPSQRTTFPLPVPLNSRESKLSNLPIPHPNSPCHS